MAEKRPGGLTALAVLNFVFAGLGTIGLLAFFALLSVAEGAAAAAEVKVSTGLLWALILLGFVRMGLLITAGVGYLKQKRFLGRTLGNTWAVLALADTGMGLAIVKTGFSVGTLIGLVYPVLTLILLNTTFKDDLVN
jgi:hypothetical protein